MRAGDVLIADFGVPLGSEPGFRRPVVLVSADVVLEFAPRTIHVVPCTSRVDRDWLTDVPVDADGLQKQSVAQCHLLTVVPVEAVGAAPRGNVGPVALAQIRSVIADLLDIDGE
jgi:mRNA interferase MazF